MKITLLTLFILSTTLMAEAQIQNVSEKNGMAVIDQESNYRSGSSPLISLRDGYLAGWNSQVVVVVHNANSGTGGNARIYDYKGNVKRDSDLGMMSMANAKITVTSNGIVVNKNGSTYNYDLDGKRK